MTMKCLERPMITRLTEVPAPVEQVLDNLRYRAAGIILDAIACGGDSNMRARVILNASGLLKQIFREAYFEIVKLNGNGSV